MKNRLKSSIFVGIATLATLFANFKTGSLKDIAKPHLGVYECKHATLGKEDVLSDFADLRLELLPDGGFTLFYQKKEGKRRQLRGEYVYDRAKGVLTLRGEEGFERQFPLTNGKLTVNLPIGEKTLVLQFEQQ